MRHHRRAIVILVAALFVITACLYVFGAGPTALCRVDDLPEHPCPSKALTKDGLVGSGQLSGETLIEWYGEGTIGPGVHVFHIRDPEAGTSASWEFVIA